MPKYIYICNGCGDRIESSDPGLVGLPHYSVYYDECGTFCRDWKAEGANLLRGNIRAVPSG